MIFRGAEYEVVECVRKGFTEHPTWLEKMEGSGELFYGDDGIPRIRLDGGYAVILSGDWLAWDGSWHVINHHVAHLMKEA